MHIGLLLSAKHNTNRMCPLTVWVIHHDSASVRTVRMQNAASKRFLPCHAVSNSAHAQRSSSVKGLSIFY